ncbi:MAG: PIN domain-containing protein [Verrucomicrobiae bacterium]|nr:PIN domain-containing protein [Verrucomicrobiae bacterium]
MPDNEFFLDTSGLYALMAPNDPAHARAVEWMKLAANERRLAVVSDGVLSETATLLMARRIPHLAQAFFEMVEKSRALRVVYVEPPRFEQAKRLFLKHFDQQFSFVDCCSFVLMKEFGLQAALTKDHHFQQMGFNAVLI